MYEEYSVCKQSIFHWTILKKCPLPELRKFLEIQFKGFHYNQPTASFIFVIMSWHLQVINDALIVKYCTFKGVKLLCDSGPKCVVSFLYYSFFSFHIML